MASEDVYELYIDGEWVPAESGDTYNVYNPFTEDSLGEIARADKNDVWRAIDSAREAFDEGEWAQSPEERVKVLRKWADLIEDNRNDLTRLEVLNTGRPLKYVRYYEFPRILEEIRSLADMVEEMGEDVPEEEETLSLTRTEPLGVMGVITPWTNPLYIAARKLAPALAAGNSVVLKPSTYAPLTALKLAELAVDAGVPEGVLNVLTGTGEDIGRELASNHQVDGITLTGRTETGKKVLDEASGNLKDVHLELGGRGSMIVLSSADLDAAARGAAVGAFWNGGQDCTAVSRLYVPTSKREEFTEKFVEEVKKITLGNPRHKKTDMGPLASKRILEVAESYIERAADRRGVELEYGGERPEDLDKGFFLEPTVLGNVKNHHKIVQEEVMGPVVSVIKYRGAKKALRRANDTVYGLAGSVWGDTDEALEVARKLDVGTVWINDHGPRFGRSPAGGFKQSGFGPDVSVHPLAPYIRTKNMYVDRTGEKEKDWHEYVLGEPG